MSLIPPTDPRADDHNLDARRAKRDVARALITELTLWDAVVLEIHGGEVACNRPMIVADGEQWYQVEVEMNDSPWELRRTWMRALATLEKEPTTGTAIPVDATEAFVAQCEELILEAIEEAAEALEDEA